MPICHVCDYLVYNILLRLSHILYRVCLTSRGVEELVAPRAEGGKTKKKNKINKMLLRSLLLSLSPCAAIAVLLPFIMYILFINYMIQKRISQLVALLCTAVVNIIYMPYQIQLTHKQYIYCELPLKSPW